MKQSLGRWRHVEKVLDARSKKMKAELALARIRLVDHLSEGQEMSEAAGGMGPQAGEIETAVLRRLSNHGARRTVVAGAVEQALRNALAVQGLSRLAQVLARESVEREARAVLRHELAELYSLFGEFRLPQAGAK